MTNTKVIQLLTAAALLTACMVAGASPRQDATLKFLAQFPNAKFIEDNSLDGYHIVKGFKGDVLNGDIAIEARHFVMENAALFGINDPAVGLEFDKIIPHLDHRYVRFSQTLNGLPVFETGVVVHVNPQGRIIKVSSSTVSGASDDSITLSKTDAYRAASAGLLETPVVHGATLGYLRVQKNPVLVYEVISSTPGHRWASYILATGGQLIWRHDQIKRHLAIVYEQNPIATPTLSEVELENIVTEGDHVNHTYGQYARTASCINFNATTNSCAGWEHLAVATESNGFLDVAPVTDSGIYTDGFAEVMAYYALDRMQNWYRDEFGFVGQYVDMEQHIEDGTVEKADYIWLLTNANYANGFFSPGIDYPGYESPDFILLGAITTDLAYDNDVTWHEFTHAVSSKAFGIAMGDLDSLGLNLETGGLEEGTADYFSSTFAGNSSVGEYAGIADSGRDLDNDSKCPDDLMGEGHHDGQITGGAAWEIRTELGAEKADHLVYGAMINTLSNFGQYSAALIAQAETMKDEEGDLQFTDEDVALVRQVVESRNIDNCERILTLNEGDAPVMQYMAFGINSQGTPSTLQYKTVSNDTAEVLVLKVVPGADSDYDVLVREGEPIEFTWDMSGGFPFPWEAEYDMELKGSTSSPVTEVRISNATELKLKKNTEYFFSIISRPVSQMGCRNNLLIETFDEPDPEPEPDDTDTTVDGTDDEIDTNDADTSDTDTDTVVDDDDDDGNCGCRVAKSNNSIGLWDVLTSLL